MLLGSAGFAAYQSGGTVVAEQASTAASEGAAKKPTTRPTPRPVTSHPPTAPTPYRPPQVTGTVNVTGPFSLTYSGKVSVTSSQGGQSCAELAAGAFFISFNHDQQLDYRNDHLSVSVNLPNGTFGPGNYSLATTRLGADGNWSREGAYSQVWSVRPGLSRATVQLRPDASGVVTVTDLMPLNTSQTTAPANLQKPLSFILTFSCS
jgi:hypothetical protein